MVLNLKKLKKQTIALLVLIASGTLSIQLDWVKDRIIPLLANHPHWSSLGTGLVLFLTALHSPEGKQFIKSLAVEESTENTDGSTSTKNITVTETKTSPTP